ncbi:hypothetical protein BCR33DRAFT_716564 [Rhizoclosmatium globosum]|uniref:C2 domain-containing protein n=1 Tax=Rhizoclosmatium globosum TaxID=329046 RepID=A0A1Y2CDY9_9FUNG|nr:hypothetical protein BCR33DRAFT_716564 [Rhizoclosmatium globosum]|eukprot:ORY45278.1 hypothetical protein BCR33DRAFT_716564 [Rhizoclosmatium globosum]
MEASEAASQSKKDALERARARVADRKRGIRSGVPSRANVEVEVDVLGLAGRAATAIASGSEQGTDHLQSAKSSRRSDLLSLMDDGRASKSNSNSTTSFKSEPKSEFLSPISPMTPFKSAPRRSSSALNLESARDLADVEFAKSRYKRMSISRASIGPKMDLDPAPPAGSRDLRASVGSLLSGTYQRKRSLKDDEKERAKREKDESNEVLHETTDDPDAIVQDDEAAGKKSKKKKNKKKKKERKRRLKKEKKEKRRESSKSGEETGASDADKEDNEDPFDEFREATERAEREMISTYVERSKWESGFNPTGELITNLLFYPEKYVLPPSESLTALFESLRFPDQEGLYVGRFPTVKEENLTKLERRLRASNDNHGSDWFGPNQRLAALPLPNRERTQRPGAPPPLPVAQAAAVTDSMLSLSRSSVSLRFIEDPSPIVEDPYSYINNMGLVLRKPHPTSPFRHITTTPDGYYTLVFSLGSLNFTEHPLMTEECKLAKDVEEWIYALRARKKVDLVGFLSRKLEALKYSYAEYVDRTERILSSTNAIKPAAEVEPDGIYPAKPTGSNTTKRRSFHSRKKKKSGFASKTWTDDTEAHTDRLYEFKIIQAWERIKKLRKKTNLITSSVRVMVRAKSAPTSAEEDKAEFHRQVEEELQELEELHNAEMERKSRQYKVLLKEWRKRKDAEDELKRQKMSEDKETAKLTDPLEDSDEDRVELVDDGRSGHEWLRNKRARKLEKQAEREQENEVSETPRKSIWDVISILDLTLDDSGISEPRSKSMRPHASVKPASSTKVDSAFAESSRKKTPVRKRERKEETEEETDIMASKSSLASQSSLRLEMIRLDQPSPLKVRRPSSRAPSPGRVTPSTALPKSIVAQEQAPIKMRRKSAMLDAEKEEKGIFGTADDMPVAPELEEFDANKLRLDASLRPPGAPILSISHVFSEHPTEFLQCPKDEQLRRREIESINVFAIIYYNNKEVTQITIAFKGIETITIDESPLDSNEVRLDQANVFAVRFYEAGSYGNQYIGEVFVPIPDPSETVRQHDREFKSISFTSSNAPHVTNKWIEGQLSWMLRGIFSDCYPGNSKYTDPLCVSGAAGLLNLRKLMDWIMDVKFDPNDPRNSDVLRMKQLVQMGGGDGLSFHDYWSQRKYFRLHIPSRINQITLGVGLEYSTDTKRLTLLKKRHKKEVIVKVPVPFDDKDITDDIFEKVANPLEDDATALALWKPKTSKQSDDSSTSPSEHVGFLKRIRMHQLIQRARQGRPPRVEDYIQENLRFSRLTAQPEDGCKIVCQVLRGFNVPIRKQEYRGMMEDDKERVTVRSSKTRTAIFDGPSPHWNETVSLDVIPPNNDFRPESIMDSEVGMERIYFNIFDELLIDIIDDDRVRDVEIHQRRERNWLGSFSMPFTALYEQTRIEGSFHVQIPTVLLGYEKNPSAGALDNSLFLALEATKETLVDVFITLEPPLLQPAPLKLRFLSDENDRFLRYATKWCAPLLLHPTRQFIATALDLSGRTTFICRYIRPQQPPEELLTPRHLLRYVSTIPYLPTEPLSPPTDQMLELCAGDAAEHAILLCNYLLAKGGDNIEAYVVIGHGIPEGRTAYVAMRGKSATSANVEMTLMNAITGQSYSVRDPHLPLKVVGCVFNAENVWANIQAHDDPARIVWNISAPKLWKPFFCRSFPKIEYKSVQLEKLHYKEVSARYCQELEILIEKSIVAKVEEWRGHRITRWNRLASKSLKPLVSRLESDHLQPMPPNTPQHMTPLYQALAPLKNVYRISGFPLNTTFTDVKAVVELVGATDVHMNADPSAEFALSVWCGGYPGGFVSVWIYICSLTRGKGDLV